MWMVMMMMMEMVVMMRRLVMCLDDISSHIREGSKAGLLMGGHHTAARKCHWV